MLVAMFAIERPEAAPSRAAEMALGLVPAAIGNAVFDATGVRLRRVQFAPARVKAARWSGRRRGALPWHTVWRRPWIAPPCRSGQFGAS